jgi:broad specificity phosphatase PhoE
VGRLLLIRHGESEGNRDRIFTPSGATPLTPRGVEQAHAIATRLAAEFQVRRVVSSPFRRAHHTAEIIATAFALPVAIEPTLHERHWGALIGRPYGELRDAPGLDPSRYWEWEPPGGGETMEAVRARTGPVLDRLAAAFPDDDQVVVSHGGVMTALWCHVTGEWRAGRVVDNVGLVVVEHLAGSYRSSRFA